MELDNNFIQKKNVNSKRKIDCQESCCYSI